LNSTISKLDLKRPPPNNSRIHIFFKSTWKLNKDGPYLGHKTNLHKLKDFE
jgi:hypothetical protein